MVQATHNLNGEGTELLNAMTRVIEATSPKREHIVQIVDDRLAEIAPRRVECVTQDGVKLGETSDHVRPEFDEIARTVLAGLNTFIVGPAGCGKTTLAHQVAEALGLPFGFCSLTAGISESHLMGRFVPTGENGRFEYIIGEFARFYRDGGLFLLDEGDAADANMLLTINTATANGQMATPNPAMPIIKRHPNFRLIMAANTWGHGASREYVGRNQLDAAFLDRFCAAKFALDYDEEFEKSAGHPDVVEWVHQLREAVRTHGIRRIVSTRLILDGSKRLAAGSTLESVQRSYALDWSANERNLVGSLLPK